MFANVGGVGKRFGGLARSEGGVAGGRIYLFDAARRVQSIQQPVSTLFQQGFLAVPSVPTSIRAIRSVRRQIGRYLGFELGRGSRGAWR